MDDDKCYLCGQIITDEKIGCACETVAPTCDTENPEMCESCQ
jgi:hypothetical protein